jgi:transcriptional regulator with XRE-family HTH domain
MAMGFGKRLAQLRKDRGYSVRGLADIVGVHRQEIQRLERTRSNPTWTKVLALAAALGVGVGEFTDNGRKR